MLFSEPKIPQLPYSPTPATRRASVSVLFSEPKIPQSTNSRSAHVKMMSFSALQRAENSSMRREDLGAAHPRSGFQCSSASRKFLNHRASFWCSSRRRSFSALQRAENSSIKGEELGVWRNELFQCSSASRKFLNLVIRGEVRLEHRFQCSSASRKFLNSLIYCVSTIPQPKVSVLFSEPKIPQ